MMPFIGISNREMARASTILFAGLIAACEGPAAVPRPGIDQVEYDVMSAAISTMVERSAAGPGLTEEGQPIEQVIIIAHPNHEVPRTMRPLRADDGSYAESSARADYSQKSINVTFERRFSGIGSYQLVTLEEFQRIMSEGKWRAFHRRFPGSPGLFALSRVGVSDDGNEALVYFMYLCGGTCGREDLLMFRKQDGRWIHAGTERLGQF